MPLSACHYAIINFLLFLNVMFFTAAKITSIILDNIEM